MTKQSLREQLEAAQGRIDRLEAELAAAREEQCRDTYAQFIANAPGGLSIVSPEGDILACNAEGARILGYEPEELIGRNTKEFHLASEPYRPLRAILDKKEFRVQDVALRRKNGDIIWLSFNTRVIDFEGNKAILNTFSDITPYHHALQKLELDERRFERLYALSELIRSPEGEILDFALDAIAEMTSSPIGYVYRVNGSEDELTLHAWTLNVMEQCSIVNAPRMYKVESTGIWGDPIRRREPVITNDYPSAEGRRGYPDGHLPITRHLGVPIFEEGRIVLLAGVGNKQTEYDEEDIRQIELIMNSTWRIIQRKKSRAELTAAREDLEAKVKRRTSRLELANNALIRYERIIETTPDAIALVDREYRYILANQAFLDVLGTNRDEIMGQPMGKTISKEFVDRALGGETAREEKWLDLPAAGCRYMAVTYHPVSISGDGVDFASVDARDMTDLKRSEEALKVIADRLDLATDAGNIGIWELDLQADDLHWDHKMLELYRVDPKDFLGSSEDWRLRMHPDDLAMVEREMARSIETKEPLEIEFRIIWPDDATRIIRSAAMVQSDDEGRPARMIGVNMDVTEQRQMEGELRRLASTDPLTGASNRRHFMSRLGEEFERCKRYRTSLVLVSLDIDHFKNINDRYGHPAGDKVLKELVEVCHRTLRTTDLFGRVGGEEFLAVLTQTRIKAGLKTAERLRQLIEQSRVEADGETITYTISLGVTELTSDDDSIEELLRRADNALYTAKNNGRNRVEVL